MDDDTEISVVVEICGTDARTSVLATPFRPPCRPLAVRIRIPTHRTIPLLALLPPAPLQTSILSLLSPCVGQTNSAHFGFPERTVDA